MHAETYTRPGHRVPQRVIKEEFDAHLYRDSNKSQGKENVNSNLIDTSIPKLRNKYKWLKDQWHYITDRAKSLH
jgi:hypothetical protein